MEALDNRNPGAKRKRSDKRRRVATNAGIRPERRLEEYSNSPLRLGRAREKWHEKSGATYVADGQSPSGGVIYLYSIVFRVFSGKRT